MPCLPAHRAAAEAMIDADFLRRSGGDAASAARSSASSPRDTTSSWSRPRWTCRARSTRSIRWLRRHFPFIAPSNIVFCGDKSIVDADYLIDDRPRHLQTSRDAPCCSPRRTISASRDFIASNRGSDVRDLFSGSIACRARCPPTHSPRPTSPRLPELVASIRLCHAELMYNISLRDVRRC